MAHELGIWQESVEVEGAEARFEIKIHVLHMHRVAEVRLLRR
jgi:hypothetical protein